MQRLFSISWFVFLFSCLQANAQDSAYNAQVEKIKNTIQDTERVKILAALSDIVPDGNWKLYNREMKGIAERNLKITSDNKSIFFYKKYLALAITNEGLFNYYHNNDSLALYNFTKSMEIAESILDSAGLADAYNNIALVYQNKGNNKSALNYYFKAANIFKKKNDKKGIAMTLNNIGYLYDTQGEKKKALEYFFGSVRAADSIGDLKCASYAVGNIAKIYGDLGNDVKALEYDFKALTLKQKIGEKLGEALILSNIGTIYKVQKNIPEALKYYTKSSAIYEQTKNKRGLAIALNNMGTIYDGQGDYTKAINCYEKSLKLREEIGYINDAATSLINLGDICCKQKNIKKALVYFNSALIIKQETGDKDGIAGCLNFLAKTYFEAGNYKLALEKASESMQMSKQYGYRPRIRNAALTLKDIYGALNKTKEALDMYDLYISMRDSINNNETEKQLVKQQYKHEYEIKAIADSVHVLEEKKVAGSKLAQEKTKNYALFGGLGLVMLFSVFMYNRFRITQKQKKLIELQKTQVEEKRQLLQVRNEEINHKNIQITDSIRYARNIQQSILPSEEQLKHLFKEYFLLYLPKDIVSGDFYWAHQDKNKLWFALVDCTGHGVPGAFMSIMANSLLDKIIKEDKIEKPHEILNSLSYGLAEKYKKQEGSPDGMEIALCLIDKNSNFMQLSIAGSNVYHIHKGNLTEIKGDHMPIGITEFIKEKGYTLHELNCEENDLFYFFTDGYADQKGEVSKKKFFYKPFRDLMLKNQHQPMEIQKEELLQAHIEWKGKLSQNDDISVIGFKV
jgi:serine phosphatase RsbU (regulator of sigma subunit)/Tfp pilus assembly protein PilF